MSADTKDDATMEHADEDTIELHVEELPELQAGEDDQDEDLMDELECEEVTDDHEYGETTDHIETTDHGEKNDHTPFSFEFREKDATNRSQFYSDLVLKLKNRQPELVICNAPRRIKCSHCSFEASTYYKLKRHLRFRHFTVVDTNYHLYCPVRRCTFCCDQSEELGHHLDRVHHGFFKIKTVLHEEIGSDGDESPEKGYPEDLDSPQSCSSKDCQWTTSSSREMAEHKGNHRRRLSTPETLELMYCDYPGCDYTCYNVKSLKMHRSKKHFKKSDRSTTPDSSNLQQISEKEVLYCEEPGCTYHSYSKFSLNCHKGQRHKQDQLSNEDALVSKEPTPPPPIETTRLRRQNTSKRKYYDEEWISAKPKKLRSEGSSDSSGTNTSGSAFLPSTQSSAPQEKDLQPCNASTLTSTEQQPQMKKTVRVKINNLLVNFDPVQRALIAMSNAHGSLNERMSKIDGMMEKLMKEHSSSCSTCRSSPEVMVHQDSVATDQKVSEVEKLEKRIKFLESELDKSKDVYRKMVNSRVDGMTYSALLGGVSRPTLRKENDYKMIQGYRLIDLNVMRLALQTAQQCKHGALILTEVNADTSQVDLATQLGLLCTICGTQSIFTSSSFSDEEPANYSVNKLFLPTMGPVGYYSLVSIVQRNIADVKVSMNIRKNGMSVPHKAKLIVSVDRDKYDLDVAASEPSDEIIQPDITGDYDNIAEPDVTDLEAEDSQEGIESSIDTLSTDSKDVPMEDKNTVQSRISESSDMSLTNVKSSKDKRRSGEFAELDHAYGRLKKNDKEDTKDDSSCLEERQQDNIDISDVTKPAVEELADQEVASVSETGIQIHSVTGSVAEEINQEASSDQILRCQSPAAEGTNVEVKIEKPVMEAGKQLKIKNFTELRGNGEKEGLAKHWTTVDENSRVNEEKSGPYSEICPIQPGSKIFTSDVSYTTVDKCNLPPGIYKVRTKEKKESFLIVKHNEHKTGQVPVIQKRPGPASLQGLQVTVEGPKELEGNTNVKEPSPVDEGARSSSIKKDPGCSASPSDVQRPGTTASFKTPLQLFSMEFTRALRRKMPSNMLNWSQAQINRIVIEKWAKMTHVEKQVYRAKALVLANGQRSSSSGPTATVSSASSPVESSASKKMPNPKTGLPPGWNRSIVQYTDNKIKRFEVVVRTPSGERLRTKKELFEYMRINNISGISPDIFEIKPGSIVTSNRRVDATAANGSPAASAQVSRRDVRVARGSLQGGVVKEVLTSTNGMKMVRLMVTGEDGTPRETLVPAVTGDNGTLKIALPRNYNMRTGTRTVSRSSPRAEDTSQIS